MILPVLEATINNPIFRDIFAKADFPFEPFMTPTPTLYCGTSTNTAVTHDSTYFDSSATFDGNGRADIPLLTLTPQRDPHANHLGSPRLDIPLISLDLPRSSVPF